MSADTVELFVPCELIDVRTVLAPSESDTLTPVEQFVLRALNEPGVNTLDVLTQLFGLGHRPTFDLVLDLWRRGYIEVVDPDSRLILSPFIRTALRENRLHEVSSTDRIEHSER